MNRLNEITSESTNLNLSNESDIINSSTNSFQHSHLNYSFEESFVQNRDVSNQIVEDSFENGNTQNSCISSDEDDFESIPKSTRRRIRKIASDSEEECLNVLSPTINNSFTTPRSRKIDSDEDDGEENSSEDEFQSQIEESPSDKSEVVAISSDEDDLEFVKLDTLKSNIGQKLKQATLDMMVQNMSLKEEHSDKYYCSAAEYASQGLKVSSLRTDILKCKNTLRTVDLSSLPDKGALLLQRQKKLEKQLVEEEELYKKMSVKHEEVQDKKGITWEQLQANSACVVPNTLGKKAIGTYEAQKSLTMDRLKALHDSLATCPSEDTLAEDPVGLKIELMPHQKRALAWLVWREGQKPSGGILADDMGLGKTLTMISLIVFTKNSEIESSDSDSEPEASTSKWRNKNSNYKVNGGTLVVCPASLINQWEMEINKRLKRNLLITELYHGTNRETKASRLAKHDVVITTYQLIQREVETRGPLFSIKWKRIILDEGHVIRNHKSQTSVAICKLVGKSRWVLTGTPVHNKELDLYSLLKFLKCSPFDDLGIWKQWVANKNTGGQDRLNTVITSILLRRTKEQLQIQGSLKDLPEKNFELIDVKLDKAEQEVYQKILIFSRTLFIEFLRQRASKNPEFTNIKGGDLKETNDEEFNRMHRKVMKMHGGTTVKSHEILVLLLRLRQICCHPSLITTMLDNENCKVEGIEDEEGVDMDLLDRLNNLNLDEENETANTDGGEAENLASAANKILSVNNPVFATNRTNEKLRVIQKIIKEKVIPKGEKIIIVSQWTTMLDVIMVHLKEANLKCDILDGKVPIPKRNEIVTKFNDSKHKNNILLLSLTAGGVGLNLIGANHLLLVDLHWNPQLESQAQDRIYRVGQMKPVYIYKIVTSETIEERIKSLQDKKLNMATDILSGVRPGAGSKLSLDDLKVLFNVPV